MIPVGYKLLPEKPGHLGIDDDQAEVVRAAFRALIKEGSLSLAAKSLNRDGYRVNRKMVGGGSKSRLGHFTVQNLQNILTNKAFIGVRVYKVKGEIRETGACWPPLIDKETFRQVQEVLAQNRKRKPEHELRYPFILSGLVACGNCGERMVGKSAHGNSGKVPYYEHGWATRREGCLVKPAFNCFPFRVLAKKLEPAVWEQIERLLRSTELAESILQEAKLLHAARASGGAASKIQAKIQSLSSQLEVLAERLGQLPKSVSPEPVFRQMQKIEEAKALETTKLQAGKGGVSDIPAALRDYSALTSKLALLNDAPETKHAILCALVEKIEVTEEGFKIHYYTGREKIKRELVKTSSRSGSNQETLALGSNSLTSGGTTRNRTWN